MSAVFRLTLLCSECLDKVKEKKCLCGIPVIGTKPHFVYFTYSDLTAQHHHMDPRQNESSDDNV